MPRRQSTTSSYFQPYLNRTAYNPDMRNRYQPEKRSRLRTLERWLVVLLVLAFAGHIAWTKHVAAEDLAAQQAAAQAAKVAQQAAADFDNQANQLIAANPQDTISVAVAGDKVNLQTLGSTAIFDGASTGKLLTATDLLAHAERGTASLRQQIDGQTAGGWLAKMIVNSDNNAWAELNDFLTHPDLAAYASAAGFNNYDADTNTFTSTDIAVLLQKLYSGNLLKPADRGLLLGYMSRANYRQYIVAAVPSGYTVYHKIGFDDDTLNDVAIITHNGHFLVLAIYSNGNGSYDQANRTQLIHTITKDAIGAFL